MKKAKKQVKKGAKKAPKKSAGKKKALKKASAKKAAKRLTKVVPQKTKKTAIKKPVKKVATNRTKTIRNLIPVVVSTPVIESVELKTSGKKPMINSQHNMVMEHILTHGSINLMEAIELYGVLRLGAVIHNLRQGGLNIETGVHSFKNKNGNMANVAKYVLSE